MLQSASTSLMSQGNDIRDNLAPVIAMPKQEPPAAGERRRYPRHHIRVAAMLHSGPDKPGAKVLLTDISLGGCYVETCALCPVGSKVLVRFEFCDLRISEFGRVTTNHPMVGMGICFDQTSPQLEELVDLLVEGRTSPPPRPALPEHSSEENHGPAPVLVPVLLTVHQTHELAR